MKLIIRIRIRIKMENEKNEKWKYNSKNKIDGTFSALLNSNEIFLLAEISKFLRDALS